VTLEYNRLEYEHPHIHTRTVEEWTRERASKVPCDWVVGSYANCKFDAIWSISSFEHDGLGRSADLSNVVAIF
jgi:hypothetical protein